MRAPPCLTQQAAGRKSRPGGAAGNFELLSILRAPQPLAVLERQFKNWGVIGYIGKNGPVAVLRKAAIIGFRTTRGGEILGTTRIFEYLNDWPYAHYAWALLDAGRVRHCQMAFYSHIAYHQEPGTFIVNESVPARGEARRVFRSDYCVPSQLIAPQLLRWMAVWEPWDKDELWIARALPGRWFDKGFAASAVPTRWGAGELRHPPLRAGT